MSYPARLVYLALGMPLSSFLGLVIFSAQTVLYPHYATLARDWGPTPLEDQQLAGGIMWAGGDLAFVVALVLAVAAWLRHEERENLREDARLARQRAAREAGMAAEAGMAQVARREAPRAARRARHGRGHSRGRCAASAAPGRPPPRSARRHGRGCAQGYASVPGGLARHYSAIAPLPSSIRPHITT